MSTNFKTLSEMQQSSCEKYANNRLFGTKRAGEWQWISYREWGELVDFCRGGLANLGVGKGDKVAVISDNRVEWAVGAHACYGLGAVYVPMYEKQLEKEWTYILEDCGAKVLLVANQKILGQTGDWAGKVGQLEHVVAFDGSGEGSWNGLLDAGKESPAERAELTEDDIAGLIYTSGTTGNPKGVVLTHGNLASNLNGMHARFPIDPTDSSVSFLPWAHSFGQTCELHGLLSAGGSMGVAESVEKLLANLAEVKPTLLFSVPRVFNKVYDAVQKQVAKGSPLKQKIFHAGLRAAAQRRALERDGREPGALLQFKLNFFDKLAFSKVRAKLGGNLKYAFSGGAALSSDVAEFIDSMNITVYEGYGLTETSPILTANVPGERRIGSVGRAFPGIDIWIDEELGTEAGEGEICASGPNIMQGYYNLQEKTDEVTFDRGGKRFFRTGDLGRLDAEGYLYITGRVKELYKLENGKYVAPAPLEEQIRLSGYINQAYIHGMNKPYNVALIVPDEAAVTEWAGENGLGGKSIEALCADDKLVKLIEAEIAEHAAGFKGYERPKKVALSAKEFSGEDDLLTPTMKYKRRNIEKMYGDVIAGMF